MRVQEDALTLKPLVPRSRHYHVTTVSPNTDATLHARKFCGSTREAWPRENLNRSVQLPKESSVLTSLSTCSRWRERLTPRDIWNPQTRAGGTQRGFVPEAERRRCVPGDNAAAGDHTVAVATGQECGFERPPCSAVWHPPACPQDKSPPRSLLLQQGIITLSPDCSKHRF